MTPVVYLLAFVIIVVAVVMLPVISGVASIHKVAPKTRESQVEDDDEEETGGYVPPDELRRREELKALKKSGRLGKVKAVADKLPGIKYTTGINDEKSTAKLRKRGPQRRLDPSHKEDPSQFDFDLDEFIDQEQRADAADAQEEFQRRAAKTTEELEELV